MRVSNIALSLLSAVGLSTAQTDDLNMAVGLMNQARQSQGLQPLAWNNDLAAFAQLWAQAIAIGSVPFSHASGQYRPQQGETLYQQQSPSCGIAYENPMETAARAWLGEATQWQGQPVSSGQEGWLHWSQIMWSSTAYIGCARAFSTFNPYEVSTVCRFYPEGNIIGQTPF